jgi:cyanophycin synthetase
LVVNDEVISVSRGQTEHVTADGEHTIRELMDLANQDPLRGPQEECPLTPFELDAIALDLLKRQNFGPDSIPRKGQQIIIHYNGDLTTDVTDDLRPDTAEQCILAARTVGLNIAGVDIIARDISQPLEPQGGAIIEVNASPSLFPHIRPLSGKARPVGTPIVSGLFAERDSGRIPVIAVTGTNGKTSTVNLIVSILKQAGYKIGVTTSEGIATNGRSIAKGDCSDARSARRILMNPFVNAAVFEIGAASVLNQGLAFDKCDVAVVTNIGSGDHLGEKYVENIEVMKRVKRTPVDVVLPQGAAVLNADDAAVADLSQFCKGDVIFFSRSIESLSSKEAITKGKRIVTIDGEEVVLINGETKRPLIDLSSIPHSFGGKLLFQLDNGLAAIAAAWALDIKEGQIIQGLASASKNAPVRFCCYERSGSFVVVTMCRNTSALEATISTAKDIFSAKLRTAIYSACLDHRPEDAYEQGLRLGAAFERVEIATVTSAEESIRKRLVSELERGIVAANPNCGISYTGFVEDPATLVKPMEDLLSQQLLLIQASNVDIFDSVSRQLSCLGANFVPCTTFALRRNTTAT